MTAYRCVYQTTNGAYSIDITSDLGMTDLTNLVAEKVLTSDFVTLSDPVPEAKDEEPKSRTILVKSHIVSVLIKELEET